MLIYKRIKSQVGVRKAHIRYILVCAFLVGSVKEKKTNLSRPVVSHHLKVLKDDQIIIVHRQGTVNYYYLDQKKAGFTWGARV